MKTIKIDNRTIEISDKSYEAFKKQFLVDRWVPKEGEEYFLVDEDVCVVIDNWVGDKENFFRLGQNNVFRTREEAQNHAKKLQAISDITNWCWENGLAKEHSGEEKNFFIFWDGEEWDWMDDEECKTLLVLPYLKSIKACEQVIEKFGKELKLIFNIEK